MQENGVDLMTLSFVSCLDHVALRGTLRKGQRSILCMRSWTKFYSLYEILSTSFYSKRIDKKHSMKA